MKRILQWLARRRRKALAVQAFRGKANVWRHSSEFNYWRHMETGVICYWNTVAKAWWLADGKGWLIGAARPYIEDRDFRRRQALRNSIMAGGN